MKVLVMEEVAQMTTEHSQDRSDDKLLDGTDILLVYDQQCPLCDFYSRIVRVRESVGALVLVDAREDSAVMQEITAAGLDIDQGMVLKMAGRIYYGADAIHSYRWRQYTDAEKSGNRADLHLWDRPHQCQVDLPDGGYPVREARA